MIAVSAHCPIKVHSPVCAHSMHILLSHTVALFGRLGNDIDSLQLSINVNIYRGMSVLVRAREVFTPKSLKALPQGPRDHNMYFLSYEYNFPFKICC